MKKTNHLWKRIFSLHAVLIGIAFLFVFLTIYLTMSKSMQQDRRVTMEQQLEISASKLDARVDEVMALHLTFLNDQTFRRCLEDYYDGGMTATQESRLSEMLYATKDDSWLVNTIYVLDIDYQVIDSSRVILSEDPSVAQIAACARTLARNQAFRAFFMEDEKLLFVGSIYLNNSYDYMCYVCIELSPSRMFFNFTSTALKSFDAVLVTDGSRIICTGGAAEGIDPADLTGRLSMEHRDTAYAVFHGRSSNYANWEIHALMDESDFYHAVVQQTTLVGIVLIMSIIASLVTSLIFAKRITRPLERLTSSFQRLEQGEFPPPLEAEGDYEVGQLIQGYNHVVQSLKKLNENIIAEQEEKRRFEIAALKTRLDLLQSQIRPHFIHNTLNTLKYMAMEADNLELSELITSLNALLRMSISTESDFCTVDSEIDCIRHYLRIMRSRYADRPLECSFSIDEHIKDALLPRLVLQPLVENALYHGILPVEDRLGLIKVQCLDAGDQLCVFVSDNGAGIPGELLQQLQQGGAVASGGYSHIGIHNVRERLDLMYQQECEFQIFSQVGRGTTIFFSVPYRR